MRDCVGEAGGCKSSLKGSADLATALFLPFLFDVFLGSQTYSVSNGPALSLVDLQESQPDPQTSNALPCTTDRSGVLAAETDRIEPIDFAVELYQQSKGYYAYDVSRDGQRFLVVDLIATHRPRVVLLANWQSGLGR